MLTIEEPIEFQPGTINALADRKLDAQARLAELKRQRGIALLDGQPFSNEEIKALEAEIDALTEAEGEAMRRERAATEAALEQRRQVVRKEIRVLEKQRLEAVSSAENAALDLMVSLKDIQTFSDKLDTAMRSLGIRSDKVNPDGVQERFSRRLTSVMRNLLTLDRRYGHITFPEPRDVDVGEWTPSEAALMAHDIDKALRPTSSNQ